MTKTTQRQSGYQFIAQQIKVQITSNIYAQDEKLPSVRDLATLYHANTKTIQRAIKLLESEGFIYTIPGSGTFVKGNIEKSKHAFEQSLLNNMQKSIHALRRASIPNTMIQTQFTHYLEEEISDENTI